jgi:hypothetical protein
VRLDVRVDEKLVIQGKNSSVIAQQVGDDDMLHELSALGERTRDPVVESTIKNLVPNVVNPARAAKSVSTPSINPSMLSIDRYLEHFFQTNVAVEDRPDRTASVSVPR